MSQRDGEYETEGVDRLPFSTPEKAQRYQTESYRGAVGLNWYLTDPTLRSTVAYYLQPDELAVVEPHLIRTDELMGGAVARWAEETDRDPPRLQRYDRWGHDVSRIVMPASFTQSKRAVLDAQAALRDEARGAGMRPTVALFAANYLLNQAAIGMGCALGTGAGMVQSLVAAFAPADVRDHVLAKFDSGEWAGETAQLLTERTGGSDLGALETTATRDGDSWRLNGFKWFASNCAGQAFVVLAKPEGAPDTTRGVANFLVLRTRRDGSRNGVRVRRLKDKLGTRSVASGEVEFVDAEAFLLSEEPSGPQSQAGPSGGRGLARMMALTNAARLGIASFALGNARRALVESLCYARQRRAFGGALIDKPLMRRKLAELIVDVEAAQTLVFDGLGVANHRQPRTIRQRIAVPVTKLRSAGSGSAPPRMRSRSTAATATSRTGRWPACCATRKSTRSGRARTTSCAWTYGGVSNRPAPTRRCWPDCVTRYRSPTTTTPRDWSRPASTISTRQSRRGPSSTGALVRRGFFR